MLTSMNIGASALSTFSKAMDQISANLVNMNTAGYKGSHVDFSAQFAQEQNQGGGAAGGSFATGVSMASVVNFANGDFEETKDKLHLALDANRFFVLKRADGSFGYTRNGQFRLLDGYLVGEGDARVQGYDDRGKLVDLHVNGDYGLSLSQATTTLSHDPHTNLSINSPSATGQAFNVYDAAGGVWKLNVKYTKIAPTPPSSDNKWKVEILDASGAVLCTDSSNLSFSPLGLGPDPGHTSFTFTFTPPGAPALAMTLKLDYANLESTAGPNSSTAQAHADGRPRGTVSATEFDEAGNLVITYSNGQKSQAQGVALARFDSLNRLVQTAAGTFASADPAHMARASATDAKLKVGFVEKANVDMSTEFAEMIKIQRSYQTASQIVTTANQLIDSLLTLKRG